VQALIGERVGQKIKQFNKRPRKQNTEGNKKLKGAGGGKDLGRRSMITKGELVRV